MRSGCVLIAEMSTCGALTTSDYVQAVLKMAEESDNVVGLVCQRKLSEREDLIYMTPGIAISIIRGRGSLNYLR